MLFIAFFVVLILMGACVFFLYRFINRTKNEYRRHQPALRVTNLSMMNAGDVITLTPELENVGSGEAFDCMLQLAGWEGHFSVKILYPKGPRYQRHAIPIALGLDAPIRIKPMSRCYLRVAYRDRWEQRYECWYPVIQSPSANSLLYNIHIDLSRPEFTEPRPSVRTMWALLRRSSAHE
jgi:hypothetical protein